MILNLFILSSDYLIKYLPISNKKHENNKLIITHNLISSFKGLIVSTLSNYGIIIIWNNDNLIYNENIYIYLSGIIFTSYEFVDLIFGLYNRLHDSTMIIHHIIHFVLGIIMIINCGPVFNAAILLSQETSTIFLGIYSIMKNRYSNHYITNYLFYLFTLNFLFFRICLGTYGIYYFINNYNKISNYLPYIQLNFMFFSILIGVILQFNWAIKNLIKIIKNLIK
tara:strand:- start:867 stop:1538 length:672 start_codon:yes stop_codon:yes gene_type:complete